MNRILISCLIGLAWIALPGLASAEFYRYVDKEGKVHYTDNLANVPADQREGIDQFEDISPEPPRTEEPTEETNTNLAADDLKESQETYGKETAGAEDVDAWEQRLSATGAKLLKEYEALMQKKEELDEVAKKALTPPERQALNDETRELNRRIKDYDKRKQAFDKEVEAYNASTETEAQPSEASEE